MTADLFWGMTVVVVLAGWDFGAVSYYDKLNWVMLSVVIAVSAHAARRTRTNLPWSAP